MKTNQIYIFLIIAFINIGCRSFKNTQIKIGGPNEAIRNAIFDFSNSEKLYNNGNTFSVSVFELANQKPLVVRIGKNNIKFLLTAIVNIDTMKSKLPTRYFENEEKLFFWWDNSYPLTKEALNVFKKYNLLQDDENGIIIVPDISFDDTQKAVHYYFCPNDLTRYKKVITNKGIGYYDPPKLKCTTPTKYSL